MLLIVGSINMYYQLTSNQYIPERMVQTIDKATISMKENGLHSFYESFGSFLTQIHRKKRFSLDDYIPMKLNQIWVLLLFIVRDLCCAFLAFFVELIVYRYKQFRNRRIVSIPRR